MLNVPTMDKLRSLKFHGMLKGLEEQMASKSYQKLSFEERLGLLVDLEIVERDNRRFLRTAPPCVSATASLRGRHRLFSSKGAG